MVVADAGPLIAISCIQLNWVLPTLFEKVYIPPAVYRELSIGATLPGARRLEAALDFGWIEVTKEISPMEYRDLKPKLDMGEAAAIHLARKERARLLLIDDIRGRKAAKKENIPIMGVGGFLLTAKRRGLIHHVFPWLQDLEICGYRMSSPLMEKIIELADE